ncbi:MAG: hypothetical protein H0T62_11890 [Parachlamydiaceae bacterium]|nr:hypothetical protein [Parachlamydiaceae bacterium]
MATSFSTASISWEFPFCQKIDVLNDVWIWDVSLEIYKSPFYKFNVSILKSLTSFQTLAEPVFSTLTQVPEIIRDMSKVSSDVMSASSKKIKDISIVYKFIFLYKYPKKIHKVYKRLKKSLERRDNELIIDACLDALNLIGKSCSIPKTIYKFMGDYTPDMLASLTGPLGNIADVFSLFSLVSKKRKHDATTQLLEELKFAKYSEFLESFDQHNQTSSVALEALSLTDMRERVRNIKKNQSSDPEIEAITLLANKAFLKALTKKISENSKVIKTHFKISESEEFLFVLKQGKKQGTDLKKSKMIVKNIKLRLEDKILFDKCSIFTSICSICSTVVGIFKTFGLVYPPLNLAMIGVSCISSFVSANVTFYEYSRKKEFLNAMRIAPAA